MKHFSRRHLVYLLIGAFLGGAGSYYTLSHPSLPKQLITTAESATRLRGSTPDPSTRFERAYAGPGLRLTYDFMVQEPAPGSATQLLHGLSEQVPERVCSIEKLRGYLDQGVTITYQYRDTQGNTISTIKIKEQSCLESSI